MARMMASRRWLAACLFVAGAAAGEVNAEPACERDLHQFNVQAWHPRDGLPVDAVMAIAQTPDGFLWIGMEDGLARFDGTRFTPVHLQSATATGGDWVRTLTVPSDGMLYVGTGVSGVRVVEPDLSVRPVGQVQSHETVQALLIHGEWRLAGMRGGGLYDFSAAAPAAARAIPALKGRTVTALAPRRAGGVWVGLGPDGLRWYDGRNFHAVPALSEMGSLHVEDLLEARDGVLWLGTRSGLYRVAGDAVRRYGTAEGLRSDVVRSVLEDRQGRIWVGGTGDGIGRLCGERFQTAGAEHGLPSSPVEQLLEDQDGAIWVAGGGVVRLSEGLALPLATAQGLPDKPALAVLQDRTGVTWIGTFGGGLVRWDGEQARVLTRARDGLAGDFVLSLAEGPDGDLWVGGRDGLDRVRRGKVVARYGDAQGLPASTVSSLLMDEGRLWLGTVGGLAVLRENAEQVEAVPGGDLGAYPVTLFRDSRGTLWVGTDGAGVFQVQEGRVVPAPFAADSSANTVFGMVEVRPGVYWFATGSGLLRWDGSRLARVGSRQGLPADNLVSIRQDDADRLWVGSNRGVLVIELAALDAVAHGRTAEVPVRLLTEADGMPSSEANGGFQPAVWRDSGGRMWFPTRKGVAVFDPAQLSTAVASPRVVLQEMRVDGRRLPLAGPGEIPPNPGVLEISYVAPSYAQRGQIEYAYRLQGFDDAWYEALGERTAVYRRLPPGRYRFEVRARHAAGPWSAPAALPVAVQPHLFERWDVRTGAALLLLLGAFVLLQRRRRMREIARREREQVQKLEVFGQITGGVAHDFNNVLAAIVQGSEALAAALPLNHPLQAASLDILRATDIGAALTRQLLAFARREESEPRWVDLTREVGQMEPFLRRLLPDSIRFEFSYEPCGACLIDPVHVQQILLNLVVNARDAMPDGGCLTLRVGPLSEGLAKGHSDARGVAVLSVEDTGIGMAEPVRSRIFEPYFTTKPRGRGTGLGLAVTYGLVRRAGGSIEVRTAPGCGSTFTVRLPVQRKIQPEPAAVTAETPTAPFAPMLAVEAADGVRHRLLVLDDDPGAAAIVARLAEAEGFEARVTQNADAFFAAVEHWHPAYVVIDLVMPGMDGVEVLRALGDGGYRGRIVIASGMGAKVLEAARRSGAAHGLEVVGVLAKPFRAEALRALLHGTVRSGPAPAAQPAAQALLLEHELGEAIERGEFVQYYQPELDLRTGQVVGFESLVRWRHPTRGLVFPDQFIPLAERTGRIEAITTHVIHASLEWLARTDSTSNLSVSINLSARNLNDAFVFEQLQNECDQLGLDPGRVTLELTETSAMLDAVAALDMLTRLRLKGYGLAIDDFGTGYSSMLQLARLPFSQIKIDKSFVMSMRESAESRKIVESTISLGRALMLVTVAEGVEDAATLDELRALGCDRAQGYHLARPMDGDAARDWLRSNRTLAA